MGEGTNGVVLNENYSMDNITQFILDQCGGSPTEDGASGAVIKRDSVSCHDEEKESVTSGCSTGKVQESQRKPNSVLDDEVAELRQNVIYISHQVTLLMKALHVPACRCETCQSIYQKRANLISQLKNVAEKRDALGQSETAANSAEGEIHGNSCSSIARQQHQESSSVTATNFPQVTGAAAPHVPSISDCEALLSQIFTHSGINPANVAPFPVQNWLGALGLNQVASSSSQSSTATATVNGNAYPSAPNSCGRKSKYCSEKEKKAVAEYANIHGATAAARKFHIPTPVAAYYHRKEYKYPKSPGRSSQLMSSAAIDSPTAASGEDGESSCFGSTVQRQASGNSSTSANQSYKINPAHSSGSPGFLRGRGRGRPKLIGDELDAELVDYMVQVKQAEPRGHLTASHALSIARDFILEKAPGLLEEHGGSVKLKLTWAMKLVSRISERQKEIELGLPVGTISNMSKTIPSSNVPGGNAMADMVAQNAFTQHIQKQPFGSLAEDEISAYKSGIGNDNDDMRDSWTVQKMEYIENVEDEDQR
ncbi:hypothetical protein AB6A40_005827 [Gnathostoma spinigerum]|uniref:Uncharacterized protein n=1 Tax=Gnathostoma spinigerum TaxID=75299 RepID=A0ABD6EGK4_9BILA